MANSLQPQMNAARTPYAGVSSEGQFLSGLRIQCNVIRALILREIITRWGRKNIGFLWLFAEPLVFVLILVEVFSLRGGGGYGGPHQNFSLIAFVLTGYCLVMVWRNSASKGSDAVSASASLLHHRNVRPIDLYLSRLILEFIGISAAFFGLVFVFSVLELTPWPKDILRMMIAWFLMLWFALGFGLFFGTLMALSDIFAFVWRGVNLGLFFVSGVFFFVAWLPVNLRELVLWVPMVHGTEMLRHGYFGDLVVTYENPWYLISWNLVLSFLGLWIIRSPKLIDLME